MYERGYRFGKKNPNRELMSDHPDYIRGFKVGEIANNQAASRTELC